MSPALATPTIMSPLVTKLVDLVRNLVDPDGELTGKWKALWNALAVAIGVGVAIIWHLNLLPQTFAHTVTQRWAGWVLTGTAMGGVASGWHELFDSLSGLAKVTHSRAEERRHAQQHAHNQQHKHGAQAHSH